MSIRRPWLKVGASWEEIVRDYYELKPTETHMRYTVTGGTIDEPDIEKREKGPDDDDTTILMKDELIEEGLLLDMEPEIYEQLEIDEDYFFFVGMEELALGNIRREAYRFIRRVRMECERCGGTGDCEDCSSTGECQECAGERTCEMCDGTGTCMDCEGEGRCDYCEGSGRCQSCEGSSRIQGERCTDCDGTGNCESCGGNGLCESCKGTKRCVECSGTGKCGHCQGTGRCGFCNGNLKCRDCNGTGNVMMTHQMWYDRATERQMIAIRTSGGSRRHR